MKFKAGAPPPNAGTGAGRRGFRAEPESVVNTRILSYASLWPRWTYGPSDRLVWRVWDPVHTVECCNTPSLGRKMD